MSRAWLASRGAGRGLAGVRPVVVAGRWSAVPPLDGLERFALIAAAGVAWLGWELARAPLAAREPAAARRHRRGRRPDSASARRTRSRCCASAWKRRWRCCARPASTAATASAARCPSCPGTCSSARPARARPPRCSTPACAFRSAIRAASAAAGRRRHAQLRLVVHRRGGAARHRRPLHHAGKRPRGRRGGVARLPRSAQALRAAPAAERRDRHV